MYCMMIVQTAVNRKSVRFLAEVMRGVISHTKLYGECYQDALVYGTSLHPKWCECWIDSPEQAEGEQLLAFGPLQ